MDSLSKEQVFDAISMAILFGYDNVARYLFYESLHSARDDIIEECIELAFNNDAFYLVKEIESMKETKNKDAD